MGRKLIDQYSLLHLSVGVILYFFGINFYVSVMIHILFEIIENSKRGVKFINKLTFWPGGKPYTDSLQNTLSDTVFFIMGWLLAQTLDNYVKKL
jgi:hypothetical protein